MSYCGSQQISSSRKCSGSDHMGVQVSRQELDKVRSCKSNLNKMMARVLELKQVICSNLYAN